jgi:hypothetical protein
MASHGEFITPPDIADFIPPEVREQICRALMCPGCPDCRDDDSDTTWDGKDDENQFNDDIETTA